MIIFLIIITLSLNAIEGIWPPTYKINLTQSEEFVIGEKPNYDDFYIINGDDNDEMIQEKDVIQFDLDKEDHLFDRLHKHVKRFDKKDDSSHYIKKDTDVIFTSNDTTNYDDLYELEPFEGDFNTNIENSKNVTKQIIEMKNIISKRENDYNYNEFHQEYQQNIAKQEELNEAFKPNVENDTENFKGVLNQMLDFKSTPRNCTAEEISGIGFGAVKCVWIEAKSENKKESTESLLKHVGRIVLIWIAIYFAIALPFWCQKGWCCCCCRCMICKPLERLDEAKKYYADNPPGKYFDKDKQEILYKPTKYEIEAYKQLENTLINL